MECNTCIMNWYIKPILQIIVSASSCSPVILYIRDVDIILRSSPRAFCMFQKMLNKQFGRVLIIGSHFLDDNQDSDDINKDLTDLFPYILETRPPNEEAHLQRWTRQMRNDMIKAQDEILKHQIVGGFVIIQFGVWWFEFYLPRWLCRNCKLPRGYFSPSSLIPFDE